MTTWLTSLVAIRSRRPSPILLPLGGAGIAAYLASDGGLGYKLVGIAGLALLVLSLWPKGEGLQCFVCQEPVGGERFVKATVEVDGRRAPAAIHEQCFHRPGVGTPDMIEFDRGGASDKTAP